MLFRSAPNYFPGATQQNGVQVSPPGQYSHPAAPVAEYSQPSQPYGVASPPPVSIPQYQGYPTTAEGLPTNSSVAPIQSPPPIPQQAAYAPPPPVVAHPQTPAAPQASLARHNTVATHPSQQFDAHPAYITRAKTMSHTPQQLQQLQQTVAPSQMLPNFPVVPTAAPQPYQAYASPPPVEEREALLIDL